MTNTISRRETFELLNDYPQEAVVAALEALGYDSNAERFPTDIIEQVEGIIETVGVAHKKVLAASPEPSKTPEEALVIRETTALAGEILDARNCSMDSKVLVAVAQAMVAGGRHKAEVLLQLQEQAFVNTLKEGNRQLETALMQTVVQQQKNANQLFSPENLEKIVSRGTARHDNGGFDVDSFLGEVRTTVQGQKQAQAQRTINNQALAASQQEFDVDSFLEEVWGEN